MKRRNQIGRQLKRESREHKAQARFVESPTPKKARRIARAEAGKEYSPVLRGLKSEIRGSVKREKDLGDWYSGLSSQIGQTQQNAAATSQAAESALTQRLANASASDSANLKDLASQDEATAKLLGGPTNSRGLAEAAAGNTAVAQQRVSLTSPLTAERASYGNYLGQRKTSSIERGIEARGAETARRRKIKEDLRAGKKERGQAFVSNLEKLREGARDYAIQKQAFGQKSKESALGARQDAADRRLKAREGAADRSIDVAKLGQGQQKIRNEERKIRQTNRKIRKEGKAGGLSSAERQDQREGKQNASAAARTLFEKNKWPSWAALTKAVAKESEVSPAEARQAVERIRKKTEGQQDRQTEAANRKAHATYHR